MQKEKHALLTSVYGGLEAAVDYAGGQLSGLSVSFRGSDVLLTVRAHFPAGGMICFVGSDDLPRVLGKAEREVKSGRVHWKEDKWAVE